VDDEGTPFPPETPAGENPPDGAILDYWLGDRGAHLVELAILDAQGALVRRWSSTDALPSRDPHTVDFPAFWLPAPAPLDATPGLHRFVWDLHHAATVAPSPDEASDPFFVGGVWAVPGTYTVRLNVDGRTLDRPLRLALDPRETATPTDLAAQFALSREVEALRVEVLRAARRQPQNGRFADIDAALARIERSAQSAPAAPTADERAAFAQQQAAFRTATGMTP
jgi:hypothetical protein